jgi:hypothetical protein
LIGAFGDFQCTPGGPENVMPQLSVVSTSLCDVSFGFVGTAGCLRVVVIDEPGHSEFEFFGSIRACVFSSKAVVVVDVKALATIKCPNGRRGATTLASAENRVFVAVGIRIIGDPELGLDAVDGMLKHVTLDVGDVAVEAIGSGNYAGYRWDDPVKARGSVVAKLDVGESCCIGIVHLEDFDYYRVMGGPCWAAAVAAWVQCHCVFTFVHESSEVDSEEQAVVCLVEMDHSKSVDSGIAWFLLDHCIDNLAPSAEAVTMADGVLQDGVMGRPDSTSCAVDFFEFGVFRS